MIIHTITKGTGHYRRANRLVASGRLLPVLGTSSSGEICIVGLARKSRSSKAHISYRIAVPEVLKRSKGILERLASMLGLLKDDIGVPDGLNITPIK